MRPSDDTELHQLFYISRSLAGPEDVERILAVARRENARRGVTGALLYSGGCFAQLLEGSPAALGETMAAIERDPRHAGLQRLHEGAIPARRCGRWAMAFLGAPGADDLIEQLLRDPGPMSQARAQRLLDQLLQAADLETAQKLQ